jgi:hypothetical protein
MEPVSEYYNRAKRRERIHSQAYKDMQALHQKKQIKKWRLQNKKARKARQLRHH